MIHAAKYLDDEPATSTAAATPAPALSAASKYLDDPEEAAPTSPDPKTSAAEAFGRGAAQGATLGFADEIAGLGKALFNTNIAEPRSGDFFGQKYRKGRDETREADKTAQAEHPGWYTGGNVAGTVATSFVPGLGVAKGAGALKTALAAGRIGAAQGLGESEATDLGGMARDAAASGAGSAVTAGMLSKFLGGAPTRVADRLAKAEAPLVEEAAKPSKLKSLANIGLAMASPAAFVGKTVAGAGAKSAGRIADAGLATLVEMAQRGNTPAEVMKRAIDMGLPIATASALTKLAFGKGGDETPGN